MSDGGTEQDAIHRTCPGCETEMDVSDGPYIYIGYHLRPDDGGFCCSSECAHDVIDDQGRIAGDGPMQQVTIPQEELQLIVDLANAARKLDDGRVAPLLRGSARAMAARRATDKHDRMLRRNRGADPDGDRDE